MSEFQDSKVYYYETIANSPIIGRGEPLRLLLDDAGIKYQYIRYTFPEWPAKKQQLIEQGFRVPTLPFIVTKAGDYYGSTAPLMRYISKGLNKYIPKDPKDEFLADAYSDIYLDWMSKWVEVFVGKDPELTKKYENEYCANKHANFERILGDKEGAYIFGDEISYADFLLYHQLNNDNRAKSSSNGNEAMVDASKYPRLAKFVKTILARPSLKAHFENEEKEYREIKA